MTARAISGLEAAVSAIRYIRERDCDFLTVENVRDYSGASEADARAALRQEMGDEWMDRPRVARGLVVEVVARRGWRDDRPQRFTLMTVDGKEVAPVFEPKDDAPAIIIETRELSFGVFKTAFRAELVDGEWQRAREPGVGPMFDGRFVWTSDSRFATASGVAAGAPPVPLHDRWETPEQYASYD